MTLLLRVIYFFNYKDIKKKYDEINKNTLENIPISTSDPSKYDCELFITNLPQNLSPKDLLELLNTAMIAIGGNVSSGNPVVSAWMKEDSSYAFLEFRTPEEANNAFKLDGISILEKV